MKHEYRKKGVQIAQDVRSRHRKFTRRRLMTPALRPTVATVTLRQRAILCDFDGCWNSLVVSSPVEISTPPVHDIIQHRAWCKGWTTDDEDRDFCSRHRLRA